MKKAWNKLDLTGQRFGNLLVVEEIPKPEDVSGREWKIRWKCICDCGNECIKETSKLHNQGSICCPECAKKLYWKDRKEDLTGMTFGQLTVIKETDPPDSVDRTKNKKRYWECRCSCGEVSIVNTTSLKSGKATMCWTCAHYVSNSYKRKDYTGQTFDDLTVLEMIYPDRSSNNDRRTKCRCRCSCGNEVIRTIDNIIFRKYHQSCGCIIESSYEKMTELILNELGLHYKTQYSFDDCIYKYKLRFDFAVIDDQNNVKCLIENDGEQHYRPVDIFGGQEEFEIIQKRDQIKNDYCKKNNITLLRFPYYFSREQIKSEIEKVI